MEITANTVGSLKLDDTVVVDVSDKNDIDSLSALLDSLYGMLVFDDYLNTIVLKMSNSENIDNFNCELSSGLNCYPFETLLTSFCKDNGASTWKDDVFLEKISFLSRTIAASPIQPGTNIFIVVSPTKASDFYDKTTSPDDTTALEQELKRKIEDGTAWKSNIVQYPSSLNVLINFEADLSSKLSFSTSIALKLWIYWFKDDDGESSLLPKVGLKVKQMNSPDEYDKYKDNTGPYWMINDKWYTPVIDVEFSTKLKLPYAFTKGMTD